ncbi:hypothetical protein V6N12_018577 [Hibiscus sabdariffa]|uniref:Uncharacterized protein n=1 Tax=Hibiscus sabdariffa TaxID=183260 RepID=A0ABR2BYD9_9ROSI
METAACSAKTASVGPAECCASPQRTRSDESLATTPIPAPLSTTKEPPVSRATVSGGGGDQATRLRASFCSSKTGRARSGQVVSLEQGSYRNSSPYRLQLLIIHLTIPTVPKVLEESDETTKSWSRQLRGRLFQPGEST